MSGGLLVFAKCFWKRRRIGAGALSLARSNQQIVPPDGQRRGIPLGGNKSERRQGACWNRLAGADLGDIKNGHRVGGSIRHKEARNFASALALRQRVGKRASVLLSGK